MNKRRERTLQDLCDATTNTEVTSQISKNLSSCGSQKFEHRGKSGACNVCSAPCSSCSHGSKVVMNSTDESAGETFAEHVPADCDKQVESSKLNDISTVSGVPSNSDSFSENAVGKVSLRPSDAHASDDNVGYFKSEDHRALEGQDDCVSCVSGADEHANIEYDVKGGKIKSKNSRESSDKVLSNSSPVGLDSQNPVLVEIPLSEGADDATEPRKVYTTFSRASFGKSRNHDTKARVVEYDKIYTKRSLMEGSSEPLRSSPSKEVNDASAEAPVMAQKSGKENGDVEVEPTDETDDSDLVEHDVKVCDICGDAGREELLAICCRCSDGAEHTYCMREMLSGVPKGDWLCEECSYVEIKSEGLAKIERIDGCGKNSSSCQASGEHVTSSEVEGQRSKDHLKTSGKRLRDDADAEVSSRVKRSALDTAVKSPKASMFSKSATLSRELSCKNLDKNSLQSKLKPSPGTAQVSTVPESASNASEPKVKDNRGTFSKSNSFNSLNSKPKVKLVDQVAFQRQRSARERPSYRLKEGVARPLGKSVSFKSSTPSRSDSRTEILSPRLSRIQDSETTKKRSSFDRQSSFRKEYQPTKSALGTSSSSALRSEKKMVSRDISSSVTNIPNNQEAKPVYTDGKLGALSRSSSHLGEFKRPSLHTRAAPGVSSTRGDNTEQKANQISPKEDPILRSVAEKSITNANEDLVDGLSRPRDSSNSTGRVSGGRFRPASAKPQVVENDNLKAAIEAVLRKPDLYRKHRPPGQSDGSSTSVVGGEIVSHQDRGPKFVEKKQFALPTELPERHTLSRNSLDDSVRDCVRQSSSIPAEGLSSFGDGAIRFDGNFASNGMFGNVPATMPLLHKSLAIPDNEYIWQGSFEICRSGKIVDLWDGLQAYLSRLASPKVNEAVNKFSNRILLYEVPRLSTWPIQFQENGVGEDDIALFFFAKDLESYDKIYKVTLDNMMKNDLALKADIDGVELLIFPSNQLPDNAQRWNMLFFLWAVFRVKKESCLQPLPESTKQVSAASEISPAIMSVTESRCSLRPNAEDQHAIGDIAPVHGVAAAEKLCTLLTSRAVNGDCDAIAKVPSLDKLDKKSNSSFSAAVRVDDGEQCQEPREPFLEQSSISSRCGLRHTEGSAGGSGREEKPMYSDQLVDGQQSSCPFNEHQAASCGKVSEEKICETTLDIRNSNHDEAQLKNVAGDVLPSRETSLINNREIIDLNMECVDTMDPQTLSGSSQISGGGDDACNKSYVSFETVNHKAPCSRILGSRANEASDKMDIDEACDKMGIKYASQVNHKAPCSSILENQANEASDKMDIDEACDKMAIKYQENGERHLFPAESRQFNDDGWKMNPFKQDRLHSRAPVLELALGAESEPMSLGTQPLLFGRVDRRIIEKHVPDEAMTAADDDVSASLSLSLGFPFPRKGSDH